MKRVQDESGVQQAVAAGRTAVLFHATWCPFCRAFRPTFEKRLSQAQGVTALEVLLDDEEDPLWEQFKIEVVPTLVFFDGGVPVERVVARPGVGLRGHDLEAGLVALQRRA